MKQNEYFYWLEGHSNSTAFNCKNFYIQMEIVCSQSICLTCCLIITMWTINFLTSIMERKKKSTFYSTTSNSYWNALQFLSRIFINNCHQLIFHNKCIFKRHSTNSSTPILSKHSRKMIRIFNLKINWSIFINIIDFSRIHF